MASSEQAVETSTSNLYFHKMIDFKKIIEVTFPGNVSVLCHMCDCACNIVFSFFIFIFYFYFSGYGLIVRQWWKCYYYYKVLPMLSLRFRRKKVNWIFI